MLKISFSSSDNIFFTSDLHFRHGNIIKFVNRPFDSIQTMNTELIENWNNIVPNTGVVFILGDFCFGNKSDWRKFLRQLNGYKYLILGNHDRDKDIPKEFFLDVFDMAQLIIEDSDISLIMSHYPLATWAGFNKKVCNIHGHIHSTPNLDGTGFDIHIAKTAPWNQYDVGVDRNNFVPIKLNRLLDIFKSRYELLNN